MVDKKNRGSLSYGIIPKVDFVISFIIPLLVRLFSDTDVDECKKKTSGCSQECNNTIGSYKCFCKDGFRLTNNSHTCEGKLKL